jgi:hypothetical protein
MAFVDPTPKSGSINSPIKIKSRNPAIWHRWLENSLDKLYLGKAVPQVGRATGSLTGYEQMRKD